MLEGLGEKMATDEPTSSVLEPEMTEDSEAESEVPVEQKIIVEPDYWSHSDSTCGFCQRLPGFTCCTWTRGYCI